MRWAGQAPVRLSLIHIEMCIRDRSNGEARRLVVQGGVLVDGEKAAAPTVGFTAEQLAKGIVIKKGKKIYHKVTL